MTYTYKIDTDPEIIAWIEKDGYQIIRQPHHPQAYMNAPWSSVAEAEAWASAEASRFETEAQVNAEAKASAQSKLAALGLTADEIAALSK
jgi:hypothetical protein